MKTLQRHWRLSSAVLIVVLLAGSAFVWRSSVEGAAAIVQNPGYQDLTRMESDSIRHILADISLDREALVALNPTAQQAESLLSAVRTWRENNAVTLAGLKLSIDQKTSAVRKLEKAIRMGPAQEGRDAALALARQDLKTAQSSYNSALASLETSASNTLTASQRSTWAAIKTGWGQQMPIRMLDLSNSQRMAVSKAHRTWRRQRAAADNKSQVQAAASAWETALDQILTAEQKTAINSYRSNYASSTAAVSEAIDTVLPVSEG